MDKNDLRSDFKHIKSNYYLIFIIEILFDKPEIHDLLKKEKIEFKSGIEIKGAQYSKYLSKESSREVALDSLRKCLLRATIRESYEVIRDYCSHTNQYSEFESQPWQLYSRILRNSTSHDFRLDFDRISKRHFPVIWNSKTITLDMAGDEITFQLFSFDDCFKLLAEMELFIQDLK